MFNLLRYGALGGGLILGDEKLNHWTTDQAPDMSEGPGLIDRTGVPTYSDQADKTKRPALSRMLVVHARVMFGARVVVQAWAPVLGSTKLGRHN